MTFLVCYDLFFRHIFKSSVVQNNPFHLPLCLSPLYHGNHIIIAILIKPLWSTYLFLASSFSQYCNIICFTPLIQLRDVFILVFNPTNTIVYMICHSLDDIVRDVLISVELQWKAAFSTSEYANGRWISYHFSERNKSMNCRLYVIILRHYLTITIPIRTLLFCKSLLFALY